jgi:hypothetical protein
LDVQQERWQVQFQEIAGLCSHSLEHCEIARTSSAGYEKPPCHRARHTWQWR